MRKPTPRYRPPNPAFTKMRRALIVPPLNQGASSSHCNVHGPCCGAAYDCAMPAEIAYLFSGRSACQPVLSRLTGTKNGFPPSTIRLPRSRCLRMTPQASTGNAEPYGRTSRSPAARRVSRCSSARPTKRGLRDASARSSAARLMAPLSMVGKSLSTKTTVPPGEVVTVVSMSMRRRAVFCSSSGLIMSGPGVDR